MSSLDALRMRRAHRVGIATNILTDKSVAIRLRYVGAGTVTSVTANTATDITTVTVVAGATVTTVFDFASYATLGALVDRINLVGEFEAKILDGLRTDAVTSMFADGAISSTTFFGKTIWDVLFLSDAILAFTYRLSADRGFEKRNTWKNSHRVSLREIKYYFTFSGAAAGTVSVYDTIYNPGQALMEENLVFRRQAVNTTLTAIDWRYGWDYLTVPEGHDLVIRVADSTTLTDADTNTLRIAGFLE